MRPRIAAGSYRFASLAVVLLLGGCSSGLKERETGLNVLLITVDTLRADAIGAYGDGRALTPWMDRLSDSGVRFDNAHAHNVVTLPSHANILSGRYPTDHGVRDNAGFRFPQRCKTLATLLKARGYRTGAFVSAFPLDSRFGLNRGFEVYEDSFVDAETRPAFLEQRRRGRDTVALAKRWLEAEPGRFFCWVHLYESHFPYEVPESLAARFASDPYRGAVAAADSALGPLLEGILADGEKGRTLVVLTADHGESLGEHGEATHGIFAYEATLRVPLILYQPRALKPRVVSETVRHVDVLPTIFDVLSLPQPEGIAGRSLLPAALGRPMEPAPSYFEALSGPLNWGSAPLRGVIQDHTKYIELPIPELYDLGRDPHEMQNQAAAQPSLLGEMRASLASYKALGGVSRRAETAETQERLKSLGYLTGGSNSSMGAMEADDPKNLIALEATLREVVGLYAAGDLRGARERCRELVRRRPKTPISLLHLAHLERESGDLVAALSALRRALALTPGDPTTLSLLGAYLTQAGRAQDAVVLLEPFTRAEAPDVGVLVSYGLALAKAGRPQNALSVLARAHEVDPMNAMVLVDIGTVDVVSGDREGAEKAFEAALALNPRVARAHSSIGFVLAEDGRSSAALEHWKRAVSLDPREAEMLLALGLRLREKGRPGDARPYLELFVASAPRAKEVERVKALLASESSERPSK